jgi:hypothetical protein
MPISPIFLLQSPTSELYLVMDEFVLDSSDLIASNSVCASTITAGKSVKF